MATQKTSKQVMVLMQMQCDARVPRSAMGYIDDLGKDDCHPNVRLDRLNMLSRYVPDLVDQYRATMTDEVS